MLPLPSSGTFWSPTESTAALALITRSAGARAPVSEDTAASARLGYMRPPYMANRGTLRRMPSESGAAFRNPDASAAAVRRGRLHTALVASKNGWSTWTPAGSTTDTPHGCGTHGAVAFCVL